MKNLTLTIERALEYVASRQEGDGAFVCNAGKPVTFYTSLILATDIYSDSPVLHSIRQKGMPFLLSEKSSAQTLNYWRRTSVEYNTVPYPDDIDDTFVALQALYRYDPVLITEAMLADLLTLLIQQEEKPGGPYRTWITDLSDLAWQDVDIVANSNVAAFLALLGVTLPELQQYFDTAIEQGLSSKYYPHPITICYFLSKGYDLTKKERLINIILSFQAEDQTWGTSFHTACAVSALLRLGVRPRKLERAILSILEKEKNGTWEDTELYIESIHNGVATTSTCSAYISMCCAEALSLYDKATRNTTPQENSKEQQFISDVHAQCTALVEYPAIREQLRQALLPLANTCIRRMMQLFHSIASDVQYAVIHRILSGIDAATLWEHTHCTVHAFPNTLPHYGNYSILAQKSLGHALGPILLADTDVDAVEQCFTHHLIAKQLNDDAHDWREDLQRGWINSVSAPMIEKCGTLDVEILQSYFWEEYIQEVVGAILEQLKQARLVAQKVTTLQDVTFLYDLFIPLERAAQHALDERDKTLRLLNELGF